MSCVYVMAADNGEVKVGWSGTPYARLSKVRREYAARHGFERIALVGWVRTTAFLEVELLAIAELKPHASGGEWFRVDPEDALATVVRHAVSVDPDFTAMRPEPPRRRGSCREVSRPGYPSPASGGG